MKLRDWRSPIEGLDLGPAYGHVPGRGGVLAVAGMPPRVPEGMGHTHGQREAHKERERAKRRELARARYAAKAAAG